MPIYKAESQHRGKDTRKPVPPHHYVRFSPDPHPHLHAPPPQALHPKIPIASMSTHAAVPVCPIHARIHSDDALFPIPHFEISLIGGAAENLIAI